MNWRDDAACSRIGGDAWFPEVGLSPAAAKAVCRTCPVVAECLEHALTVPEKFGVWGGLTETKRRALRMGVKPVVTACEWCGAELVQKPSGARRRYCNENHGYLARRAAREAS